MNIRNAFAFLVLGLLGITACAASDDDGLAADPTEEDDLKKAATFSCGRDELKCKVGKEYCATRSGGVRPRPGQLPWESARCSPLPTTAACKSAPSCDSCFPGLGGTARICSATKGNLMVKELLP